MNHELRAIAGALIAPKPFYRFVIEVANPIVFPPIDGRCDELAGDRVRIELRLRPGARSCELFFRTSLGGMRGLPRHLGLPSADVIHADVGGDHLILELQLPRSRTLISRARTRLRRTIEVVLGHEADGRPVTVTVGDPAMTLADRLADAGTRWQLTPRQAEVLALVVRGDTNKEIALALGCVEGTVELHVTQLLRRSDASSRTQMIARFWLES